MPAIIIKAHAVSFAIVRAFCNFSANFVVRQFPMVTPTEKVRQKQEVIHIIALDTMKVLLLNYLPKRRVLKMVKIAL
jgi:hypothetical protein